MSAMRGHQTNEFGLKVSSGLQNLVTIGLKNSQNHQIIVAKKVSITGGDVVLASIGTTLRTIMLCSGTSDGLGLSSVTSSA